MSVILILFIFLLSFSFLSLDFSTKLSRSLKEKIFTFFCLLLIVLSSLKSGNTSFDTNNYITYYDNITSFGDFEYQWWGFEPGYVLVNLIIKNLGLSHSFLFFTISLISILCFRKIILCYSKYIFLSLFTYITTFYFLNEIIIIRFGLASALILLNFHFLIQRKTTSAIVCVLVASSFHATALVGIVPVLLAKNDKLNKMLVLTFFLSLLSIVFFIFNPFKILETISSQMGGNIEVFLSRLLKYKSRESVASIKKIILYIGPFFLIYITYYNSSTGNNNKSRIYYLISLYYLISFFLMLTLNQVESMSRFNSVLLPVTVISYTSILESPYEKKYNKYLFLFMFIVIDCYIFVRHIFLNSGGSINLI